MGRPWVAHGDPRGLPMGYLWATGGLAQINNAMPMDEHGQPMGYP